LRQMSRVHGPLFFAPLTTLAPKEPSAVRGGPMFEFLFGMHGQLRREGRRDRFKIVFFNPMTEPGKRPGSKAVTGLVNTMKNTGIETHLGHKIKGFETKKVLTQGGDIPADTALVQDLSRVAVPVQVPQLTGLVVTVQTPHLICHPWRLDPGILAGMTGGV